MIRGEGSTARISNELRPPDPGGGVRLTAPRDRMCAPLVDTYDHESDGEGCFPLPHVERLVPRPTGSRST